MTSRLPSPAPRRPSPLRLVALLALAQALAAPALAQDAAALNRTTILGGGAPSVTLNSALARLARDPRNITALLDAGNAALAVGDTQAALGFFTRADQVAPGNARIKAQVGSALVQAGEPTEAIRYFDAAESANGDAASFAADRALAYDLVGDNRSAQRWYQTALARGQTDEVIRRYALSLAIGGDPVTSERVLSPLIQKQDRAAWRIRTFALAIAGNQAQAIETARVMMPAQLADGVTPYLRYMPRLTRAQQAAAALLGRFPRAADIGNDDARIVQYAAQHPEIGRGLVPAGRPLGLASAEDTGKASRARRRRPGEIDPADRVTRPLPGNAAPIDGDLAAAQPARDSGRKGNDRKNGRDGRQATLAVATPPVYAPTPPAYSPPATVQARPTVAQPTVRSVLDQPPGMGSIARGGQSPVTIPVRPAPPPATTATVRPTQLATAAPTIATPAPRPATTTPPPSSTASLAASGSAGMLRSAPPPASTLAATPPPASTVAPAAPPSSAATLAAAPKVSTAAATAAVTAPQPTIAAAPTGQSFDLARLDGAKAPPAAPAPATAVPAAATLTPSAAPTAVQQAPAPVAAPPASQPVPATAKPAASFGEAFAEFAKPGKKPVSTANRGERPDGPTASRTDEETVTVTRGSRLALAEARAAKKAKAEPTNPSRVWVQIATAPSREGMAREWSRLARIAPGALGGEAGWVTSWGRNYRLLVGPFGDEDAAQDLQKELARARVSGFVWTSQAGQAVEHIAGAKVGASEEAAREDAKRKESVTEGRSRRGARAGAKVAEEPAPRGSKAAKAAAEREEKAPAGRGKVRGKGKAAQAEADEPPAPKGKGARSRGKSRADEADEPTTGKAKAGAKGKADARGRTGRKAAEEEDAKPSAKSRKGSAKNADKADKDAEKDKTPARRRRKPGA